MYACTLLDIHKYKHEYKIAIFVQFQRTFKSMHEISPFKPCDDSLSLWWSSLSPPGYFWNWILVKYRFTTAITSGVNHSQTANAPGLCIFLLFLWRCAWRSVPLGFIAFPSSFSNPQEKHFWPPATLQFIHTYVYIYCIKFRRKFSRYRYLNNFKGYRKQSDAFCSLCITYYKYEYLRTCIYLPLRAVLAF